MSALHVNFDLLLDARQMQILLIGSLKCLEPNLFLLIILYIGTFLLTKTLTVFNMNV
jgi:hypothetical protein